MDQQFYKEDKVVFNRTGEVLTVIHTTVTDSGDNLMLLEDHNGNENWRKEFGYSLLQQKEAEVPKRQSMRITKRTHGVPSMSGMADAMEGVEFNITEHEPEQTNGQNDGGENPFYKLPEWVQDADTLSEYLDLDPYQFNILKALWANKGQRHAGTDRAREANKALHYAQREVDKLNRLGK